MNPALWSLAEQSLATTESVAASRVPTARAALRRLPWLVVARLLGLLLLAAAVLKVFGLTADPVGRMGIFSTPEFQLAVIEFEVFLALWLFSGKRAVGAWTIALATFSCFAAVSFYQGWIGQSSCGCFGRLSVSPWVAFGLDILIVTVLWFGRPDLSPLWHYPQGTWKEVGLPATCGLAAFVVTAGLLLGLAYFGFGSVPAAIAYFRGERVSIDPHLVDVGRGARGETREVSVTLTNSTAQPIQFFGGTADCSCTVLEDLPVTLPANESRTVSIQVQLRGSPGVFTRKAAFLVNDEGFKRIDFRMTGQITRTASAGR